MVLTPQNIVLLRGNALKIRVQLLQEINYQNLMSSLEEKKCLLNQIIKNCNHAEHQLKKFKKSLQQEEGLENSWKNQSFIAKQPQNLIKKSKSHLKKFEKRNINLQSNKSSLQIIQKSQPVSPQGRKTEGNLSSQFKFKQIEELNINSLQISKQQNHQTPQKESRKQKLNLFPVITNIYSQTFNPKNASMSQHAMGQRVLNNSIFFKQFEKKRNNLNKQNIMKQYENLKSKNDQKTYAYRVLILRQISQQNIKKQLLISKSKKVTRNCIEFQDRSFKRLQDLTN